MEYVTMELHDLMHLINENSEISINSEQTMPKSNKCTYRKYSNYSNNYIVKLLILMFI